MVKLKKTNMKTGPVGQDPIYEYYEAPQCQSKEFLRKRRCQGLKGHTGMHWSYREDGWLEQWVDRKQAKKTGISHSSTPPGHKDYITPEVQIKKHFRMFCKWKKIKKTKG